MIIKVLGDLAKEENVLIELKIGQDGVMSIIVTDFRSGNRDYLMIGSDWTNSDILDCVKDTIRRVKGWDL